MPNLSLVVLAYNEEENVAPFLQICVDFVDAIEGDHEIIVVDDGSTDQTLARAQGFGEAHDCVSVLSHGRNQGMGAGMRTGFKAARGDYVTVLAADGQVSPWQLQTLLAALRRADIVLSVYARRPSERYRAYMSLGFRIYMRLLLGLSFQLEGIYLFPVHITREIGLDTVKPNSFFFSFDLISRALALGYRTHTVTIDSLPRRSGQSKVANLSRIWMVASEVARLRQRMR